MNVGQVSQGTANVVGVFDDAAAAARAVRALREAGFDRQDIGLAARHVAEEFQDVRLDLQEDSTHGAVTGALAGGGVGAALGAAAAALVPGVGPILAGSLLTAAVLGGAAGAAVGTFAGPFIAMGMARPEAEQHGRHVEAGKTVLVVRTPVQRQEEARRLLVDHGAYDDTMNTTP